MQDEKRTTEDDTFRILARPDFNQMRQLHHEYVSAGNYQPYKRVKFFPKHGWTWFEYVRERTRRGLSA